MHAYRKDTEVHRWRQRANRSMFAVSIGASTGSWFTNYFLSHNRSHAQVWRVQKEKQLNFIASVKHTFCEGIFMEKLTKADFQRDLFEYHQRIWEAQKKLEALPDTASTYKERKKIKDKRRKLIAEISHVRNLCMLCEDALAEMEYD